MCPLRPLVPLCCGLPFALGALEVLIGLLDPWVAWVAFYVTRAKEMFASRALAVSEDGEHCFP